jgi:hypothetical protein
MTFALALITGCGTSQTPTPTGTAFQVSMGGGFAVGAKPIRPGTELGMLYVGIYNDTKSPVTMRSVVVRGEGIGTVVKVVEIRIAPANSKKDGKLAVNSVAGALYGTNPPVYDYAGCHKQILKPLKGYVIRPRGAAHIWIVIRAVRPGKYNIPFHVVTYTDNGVLYRQVITIRAYGSVADNAHRPVLSGGEIPCVKPTGTTILSGFIR